MVREADDADDPLRLDRQVCFALSVAARSVVALYRPVLEPMGLTHPQYLVMLALWERSPLLKRLEAAGLLTRGRDRADERVLAVTLTEEGRRLRSEAEKVPAAIVARLGMEISDLENLHAALTQVIAAAREG
jgi:hypothetical protein